MSNSPLVTTVIWSPNCSSPRNHRIDRITPHCVVGQCTVQALGNLFANPARQASSNYGIGWDGEVGLFVDESNRAWTSSSPYNDNRAVTIECASDNYHPYAFHEKVFQRLIDLCADICDRNGKDTLLWLGHDNYEPKSNEMLLTVHRWYADTICPGDWLMGRMGELASEVTSRLKNGGWVRKINGKWYYVVNGKIDYSYNGVAQNENGWWKIKNGEVDFSYRGLAQNQYGWWMCIGGKVDFSYNGVVKNENGWWKVTKGKVDFDFTGLAKNENGWWYLKDGKVDFTYNGIVKNENGWWKVVDGAVDYTYNGLAQNENGWWMLQEGKVDFLYDGLCTNEFGTWVLEKGKVNFGFTGTYRFSGMDFKVEGGKVIDDLKVS